MNDLGKKLPHVLIIGGGFGGLTAAQTLARAPVRVTLIDRGNYHLFQPLLYQVAMAGLSPADIAVPIRAILKKNQNTQVFLAKATRVELAQCKVYIDEGHELGYDFLIVATGAKTNFFGRPEWGQHALGMKTVDDAIEMRRRVLLAFEAAERETDPDVRRRLLTFVIIGGGPTGVEVAGSLSELGQFILHEDFRQIRNERLRVILIERSPRLLPGGFAPDLADSARKQLADLGVEVRLGVGVTNIGARGITLDTGEKLESITVLWTAGVRAKSLAETFGAKLDRMGRVEVNQDCSIPGHPEAFAIGDTANFTPAGEKSPLPGVSPVAMQQARFVARRIADHVQGIPSNEPFRYHDKGIMATIGRSRAVAQAGRFKFTGFLAWMAWLFVHIWYLVGFRNRFIVLFNWAWNYFTFKRGARLITGGKAWERAIKLADQAEHPIESHPLDGGASEASPPFRAAGGAVAKRAAGG